MRFWEEDSGVTWLGKNTRLYPHMPKSELLKICAKLAGNAAEADGRAGGAAVTFPSFAVPGGRLACVCLLRGDRLHAAEFWVAAVGRRRRSTADQQRAFLFECLRATDPAPDSRRSVLLRCPFGAALVATDPLSGDATLRLTYR
jgi:hypothetical protein